MSFKTKSISAAVAAVVGSSLSVLATDASAGTLVLTFANNTAPSATPAVGQGGTLPFDVGTEFRVLTASGSTPAGVNDGHKDIISGGETWVFSSGSSSNIVSAVMVSVGGTPGNPGVDTTLNAPLTNAVAGFPICQTASSPTCPTLTQAAPFFGIAFNFLAPTTAGLSTTGVNSTVAGTTYTLNGTPTPFGPGHIVSFTPSTTNGFQIFFPVLVAQFGNDSYYLGGDPTPATNGTKINALTAAPPGVLFSGHIDANGDFRIYASHRLSKDEVTVPAFQKQVTQFELVGNALVISHVPIPAAAWLLGSGLVGLASLARRRKTA